MYIFITEDSVPYVYNREPTDVSIQCVLCGVLTILKIENEKVLEMICKKSTGGGVLIDWEEVSIYPDSYSQ